VKAFLTKEVFGVPVYAIAVGLVVLVGGYWFLKRTNTGQASAAPQVNSNPSAGNIYPYPQPIAQGTTQPPSSAITYSNSGLPVYYGGATGATASGYDNPVIASARSSSNFNSPPPSPTPSQKAVYPQMVVTRTLQR
jgi:hypothetical protein